MLTEEEVAKDIVCGPDPEAHLEKLNEYVEAGFTHVWVHQVGTDQEGFFQFYEQEILPKLAQQSSATKKPQAKSARSSKG